MKHIKKLYAILLCISLMLSLPIMACAESSEETEEVLEWTVSDDQSTLYYGDQVYSRCELYPYDWFRPYHFYEYSQEIETDYEYLDTVGHPAHVIESQVIVKHDIAVVYDYVGNDANYRVYVTEQGAASLQDFRTGHYAQYHLADGYSMSAPISSNLVQDWDIHWDLDAFVMNGYTKEATELGKMDHYEIIGYDETMTFAHVVGAVFDDNGTYLFVDYDSLDNSYFDAYGNLSFRQGTVPVLVLDQQDENAINEAIEQGEFFSTNTIGEEIEPLEATIAILLFLGFASPFLYLLPIALMIFGIIMSTVKKVPNRKRWKWVIILAVIWLVLAILTSAVLLVPTFFL